jgi:predicted esterase
LNDHVHHNQPVLSAGSDAATARSVVILLHGRGADARSMLPLAEALAVPGIHFMVPQAAYNRWYPNTAFGPLEANEPDLSSALKRVGELVQEARAMGFNDEQIVLGGFSQGACLACEYSVRNARGYGGLFVFSGALIGPRGIVRNDGGSFDGMPVFIGGSDVDPWVSHDLIKKTAAVLVKMEAEVDFRTYPGMDHTVNQDEIQAVQEMLLNLQNIPENNN